MKNVEMTEQDRIEEARRILGVSQYSSKRFIKNTIYEQFHWSTAIPEEEKAQYRRAYEEMVELLLKHHAPTTTKEAKAIRAQEEADKKVRDAFRSQCWKVKRAQELVVDESRAQVREVLRQAYDCLNVARKMVFIKIAASAFKLTPKEQRALAKQEAESHARYQAIVAKEKAQKDALDAYYREQNPAKKAALWKAYLNLTKEDRQKKAAEKRAEEKRIADALAVVETTKTENPALWSEVVATSAEAVALLAVGKYFWGMTLREGKGAANSYWGGDATDYSLVQYVVVKLASVAASVELGVIDDNQKFGVPSIKHICAARGLQHQVIIDELYEYAKALVSANWNLILALGTYLLAAGEINTRKFRSIQQKATGGTEIAKATFSFTPEAAALLVQVPTVQVQATQPVESVKTHSNVRPITGYVN